MINFIKGLFQSHQPVWRDFSEKSYCNECYWLQRNQSSFIICPKCGSSDIYCIVVRWKVKADGGKFQFIDAEIREPDGRISKAKMLTMDAK